MGQPNQKHFSCRPTLRGAGHLTMPGQQNLPAPPQPGNTVIRQTGDWLAHRFRQIGSRRARRLHRSQMHQIQQICNNPLRLRTATQRLIEPGQRSLDIAAQRSGQNRAECAGIRLAQHGRNQRFIDSILTHRGGLIEQREGITHRPFGSAGQEPDSCRRDGDGFARGNLAEMVCQQLGWHPPQIKALASGQDGDRHLADFGCGKDKND